MPACFIAGTDTGAGKTFCTAALMHALRQTGVAVFGFKPVASEADAAGHNADVLALQAASDGRFPYEAHNCYTFAEATAPHLAAADEGRPIETGRLNAALATARQAADWLLVEGAGGWLTPLNDRETLADWVVSQRLPVVLVVGMKLGCINHALLTAQAVRQAGLPLAGWIANCLNAEPHRLADYLATLQGRLNAPLLGVMPYLPGTTAKQAAAYLQPQHLLEQYGG